MSFQYDVTDEKSIESYAKKLVGKTFEDVVIENTPASDHKAVMAIYGNLARKGGLGNLLEKVYFGYDENSKQEADFKEAGIELKATPYEEKQNGDIRAGERVVITMISYETPFEVDFYKSHAWEKMRKMLLVYYCRNKQLNSNLLYRIGYVRIFTPPENDLAIIRHDYEIIKGKIIAGKAHELSEGDTMYLGACTKGETAEKSTVPQYYGDRIPARKRAFCFKISYMNFVLHNYILCKNENAESVLESVSLKDKTFDDYVIEKMDAFKGYSTDELCNKFDVKFDKKPKNLEAMLAYRMLGIRGNHAEEFEKANIVVKTIRIGANGKIKENMSFPVFNPKELVKEDWEECTFGDYLRETRFLFVVYKFNETGKLHFRGCQFWNIPYDDLETDVKAVWSKTKKILIDGLQFEKVNGVYRSNFPKQSENRVCHVRPHAQNAEDTFELPDGRMYPKQCFWLNNSYILEQLENRFK